MLSPRDKLTDVGALELRHADIVELEGFLARGEYLPRPGLLHNLVEHDLQLSALACALLAALVVQHLHNQCASGSSGGARMAWARGYRGVQVDDDGERDVGHGQRYDQVEEEERRHQNGLLDLHRQLHRRQIVHLVRAERRGVTDAEPMNNIRQNEDAVPYHVCELLRFDHAVRGGVPICDHRSEENVAHHAEYVSDHEGERERL